MNYRLVQEFVVNGSGYKIHVLVDDSQPAQRKYFGRLYERSRHLYRSGWWPTVDDVLRDIIATGSVVEHDFASRKLVPVA